MYYMLTSIISRSDSQLLGNKMSFCTMFHAYLFNSNKFHKFWMTCACRNSLSKDGQNKRRFRPPSIFCAGRPDTSTYMGAIFLQEQRDTFIMLISNSVGGPGRHEDQASAQIVKWGNHPSQRHCGALICNIGEMEGQHR